MAEYAATYAAPIYPPILTLNETPKFEDSELGLLWMVGRVGEENDGETSDDTPTLLPLDVRRKPGQASQT
jgi:hypothetical protein